MSLEHKEKIGGNTKVAISVFTRHVPCRQQPEADLVVHLSRTRLVFEARGWETPVLKV